MFKIVLFFLLFFSCILTAQEELRESILVNGSVPVGFYKTGIRYGKAKEDSLYIKWSHTAETDTFWIQTAKDGLEYITNYNTRSVWYNKPFRYERQMAQHHLREYILNTPLRFSNLEALSKNRTNIFLNKSFYEYF